MIVWGYRVVGALGIGVLVLHVAEWGILALSRLEVAAVLIPFWAAVVVMLKAMLHVQRRHWRAMLAVCLAWLVFQVLTWVALYLGWLESYGSLHLAGYYAPWHLYWPVAASWLFFAESSLLRRANP
jgi:hypothetical protein